MTSGKKWYIKVFYKPAASRFGLVYDEHYEDVTYWSWDESRALVITQESTTRVINTDEVLKIQVTEKLC